MPSPTEIKRAALAFAQEWTGTGNEKSDTQKFWLELMRDVLGMADTTAGVHFETRTSKHGWIDVVIPDAKTIIEQKSLEVDLDRPELRQGQMVTPFEQAKNYADSLPNSKRPDYIIVCNFDEFRLHSLNDEHPEHPYASLRLAELPDQWHLLSFLIDPEAKRREREKEVSVEAGALIGKLHEMLRGQYLDPDSSGNQHSLNVLCVRLVFCLFAEDAGLFRKDAFHNYVESLSADFLRDGLKRLFRVLDTPLDQRDPYDPEALKRFPYVNGGLFAVEEEIPPFSEEIRTHLLKEVSRKTDWSQISPTVFGGVFESTLNPETRHAGGMHYTSPENIHRLIDPLFLDELTAELDGYLTDATLGDRARRNRLEAFHEKLGSLNFLDPACGSGNFLTETYISLRRLENKVLTELTEDGQTAMGFEDIEGGSPIKVSVRQFHGIEINDFAVNVALTALWIAELQANAETSTLISRNIEDLPLTDSANVVRANALAMDWNEVLPAGDCDFVVGNPPLLGARNQTKEQKAELKAVFPPGTRNVGNIDYVAGWYIKATDYIEDHPIRCAFVSTNSICQGEQVANIWWPIHQAGVRIDFAHDTFRWANEAEDQAHVFCVIVGFSKDETRQGRKRAGTPKRLFHHPTVDADGVEQHPTQLNAYLVDAPYAFVWSRRRPLCAVPRIGIGNKPIDGGNYLFTPEEKADFLAEEPAAEPLFHRWYGSQEFIKGIERWVLWLGDLSPVELELLPKSLERARAVREYRAASKSAPTRKIAETPTRFHVENIPDGTSILIPKVSSERRRYIPLGFVTPDAFCSDLVFLIPDAGLYEFGVLHSHIHNTWMRRVGGRLKSDYRYSGGVVYNNFIWPEVDDKHKAQIEACAQAVLDARKEYEGATIAQLYDPDNDFLYPALMQAHKNLDAAVEQAYGVDFGGDEQKILEHLFQLYNEATAEDA